MTRNSVKRVQTVEPLNISNRLLNNFHDAKISGDAEVGDENISASKSINLQTV